MYRFIICIPIHTSRVTIRTDFLKVSEARGSTQSLGGHKCIQTTQRMLPLTLKCHRYCDGSFGISKNQPTATFLKNAQSQAVRATRHTGTGMLGWVCTTRHFRDAARKQFSWCLWSSITPDSKFGESKVWRGESHCWWWSSPI